MISKLILSTLLLFVWVNSQSTDDDYEARSKAYDEGDDSWYEAYLDLVVDWEEAEIRDPRLPFPSDKQA